MIETFIKGCRDIDNFSPEFVAAFDVVMPAWLKIFVPAYEECKRRNVNLFKICNVIDRWSDSERFDSGDFSYIISERSGVREMAYNHDGGKFGCFDWIELMRAKYPHLYSHYTPEYKPEIMEVQDFTHYRNYMTRLFNQHAPYDYIANQVRDYFRELTSDSDVLFSLGDRNYIALDDLGQKAAQYDYYLRH